MNTNPQEQLEGKIGTYYEVPVRYTVNAMTGKLDMTPQEVDELIDQERKTAADEAVRRALLKARKDTVALFGSDKYVFAIDQGIDDLLSNQERGE